MSTPAAAATGGPGRATAARQAISDGGRRRSASVRSANQYVTPANDGIVSSVYLTCHQACQGTELRLENRVQVQRYISLETEVSFLVRVKTIRGKCMLCV